MHISLGGRHLDHEPAYHHRLLPTLASMTWRSTAAPECSTSRVAVSRTSCRRAATSRRQSDRFGSGRLGQLTP